MKGVQKPRFIRSGQARYQSSLFSLVFLLGTLINLYMFSKTVLNVSFSTPTAAPTMSLEVVCQPLVQAMQVQTRLECPTPAPTRRTKPPTCPQAKQPEPQYCPYYPEAYAKATYDQRITDKCSKQVLKNGAWCLIPSSHGWWFGAKRRALARFHVGVNPPWATKVAQFFGDTDVVDFGAGLGQYGDHFETLGRKGGYMAFDGAINVDNFTDGYVNYADLTKPIIRTADWVLSLEVGEHIPKEYESNYVENLVKNARIGIFLSWAIPGQAGHSHVNLKSNEEVVDMISQYGFEYDNATSAEMRRGVGSNHKYFAKTVMVFHRRSFNKHNMW